MTTSTRSERQGKLVFLVLGLVVGAFAGAGVAWVVQSRARDAYEARMAALGEAAQPASRTARAAGDAARSGLSASDRTVATSSEPGAAMKGSSELFGDVQRTYGRTGITRGWGTERKDVISDEEMNAGLAQYEELVRLSPDRIGAELARRRTKTEDAERDAQSGGVLTLLDKLAEGGAGPVSDVVRDPKRFDDLFPRQTPESVVNGLNAHEHPDRLVENGVTLSFPAGVFKLRGLMKERDPFPSDVTIAGAGMDATMIVLDEAFYTRGQLIRFSIRDCTVNTNNHYMLDLRLKPASLVFERARFIGFDMGAGGSVVFGAVEHGFAIHALDCRFEGGYGRSPQHGCLLDVRNDALIARFDRCRFDEMHLDVWRWTVGTTVLFSACTMTDLLDNVPVTQQAASKPGVSFDGCSFTYFGGDHDQVPSKDLNALFPGWQQRMQ
jgi:hypothetical protein